MPCSRILTAPIARAARLALLASVLAPGASAQLYLGEFGSGVATTGDQTGYSVAILGDVNGDGTDEMVIGAPFDDDNGTDSGTVYVVNGYPQTLLYEKHGGAAGDHLGWAVANAGDVDGDGIDDFLLGEPGFDFNGTDTGATRMYSGSNGLLVYSNIGPKPGSHFGAAVAGGGDLNNDGKSDFIVGAPDWDSVLATEDKGWAAVYSGSAGNQVKVIAGTSSSARLGAAVAFVGDLNADGHADYAVGLPGFDYIKGGTTVFNAGRFDVYSGATHTVINTERGIFGDLLGTSLSRAGDTDADGVLEMIVGAPGHAVSAGAAYLYEGVDGTLLHQFSGINATATDAFGTAVGPLGDVDHDGHDDIVVGAPLFSFTTGLGGYAMAFSGATYGVAGPYGGVAASPNGGDSMGFALSASAGDLSGDDWPDLLTGWPGNDFAGSQCGVVHSFALTYVQPNLLFQGPGISSLSMYGTTLHPGGVADIALSLSKPNALAYLIASPVELIAPFKGGTLVPTPSLSVMVPFVTDAQGRVKITNVPGGGGPLIVFMQFVIKDPAQPQGWQLSNAIAAEFLP